MKRFLTAGATALTLSLVTGCAGGVLPSGGDDGASGGGDGLPYGASKEEFQEALSDMDPVTLTFQASNSPTTPTADKERAWAEAIEEWSDGKITMDVVHGQPIASYGEVTTAVADGRIDIGLEIPIYEPAEYPAINDLVRLSSTGGSGATLPEMVNVAANQDVAWNTPEIIEDYESKGVSVLVPVEFEYANTLMCSSPVRTMPELKGKSIRAGSSSDVTITESLGATPVSMDYTEVYEGLQRSVVDCVMGGLKIGTQFGYFEVAPEVTNPQSGAFGRNPTSVIAGGTWDTLPLAAQQLIFDRLDIYLHGHYTTSTDFNVNAVDAINEQGGGFHTLDDASQSALEEAKGELRDEVAESSALDGAELTTDLDAALEKWRSVALDLGMEEFDDWAEVHSYIEENGDIDPQEFVDEVSSQLYSQHRPE
ncbi:TRAP transporter substrate-binding protein DctP [Brevibacterium yomogidense]|uniref:TRAP transporter substrate-binding protein DctP n=1 Tax=Brevibacterium yomogidense TaxID=946573 RepID=UPI0018DFA109|nr:TRAP transporter substrate-binding protein DctP [Brevibacterium yomogidense]